jgi:hypothetical protein
MNNLRANGHPSGAPWRQFHCTACDGFFPEHHGTLFHGKQAEVDLIVCVLACLAEGLGIRATARVLEVEANTVLHPAPRRPASRHGHALHGSQADATGEAGAARGRKRDLKCLSALVPRARALKQRHAFEHLSYSVCLTTLIGESLKELKQITDCDRLHIYLDEQAKVAQLVPLAFRSGQKLYADGFVGYLCEPEFRDSVDTVPLQAADLLAYETLKEIRNRRARPQKPVRETLAILTSRRPHLGRFVNFDAAVPGLREHGERLPGVDDTRLGIIYDHSGVEPNRGRRLERVVPDE